MSVPRDRRSFGLLVSRALSGSWRKSPPPPSLDRDELALAAAALLATGAGGAGWWGLRRSRLGDAPSALELKNAFRVQTIHARLHEHRLLRALEMFESEDIRPLVAKGWAIARLYPRIGLRPYGDLDLYVAPGRHGPAERVLAAHDHELLRVDLHRGFPHLGRPWEEIEERSEDVPLGTTRVGVPGPEDHLSLLCTHFLFHGAWRPLWLCDVALLIEELPPGFDWDYVMKLPAREAEQVRLVALLAHRVLGASLDRTPWSPKARVPRWLPEATLRAWGRGGHYSLTTRVALTELEARAVLRALRVRWPNPIEATVRWHAPFNAAPRLPLQLVDVAVRAGRALLASPPVIARRMIDGSGVR